MSLTVQGCRGVSYTFEGAYENVNSLTDHSGVYLVVCVSDNNEYSPIDVGESATVKKNRVETHDRKDCWERNCNTKLKYAVKYTPNKQQSGRKEIEQDIQCNYNFPCGDR